MTTPAKPGKRPSIGALTGGTVSDRIDNVVVSTSKLPNGGYAVRTFVPPSKGWREVGIAHVFQTRAEALAWSAALAVELEAATMNDHATAISPANGEW